MLCGYRLAEIEDKEHFYQQLQGVIAKALRRDTLILIGDVNDVEGSIRRDERE